MGVRLVSVSGSNGDPVPDEGQASSNEESVWDDDVRYFFEDALVGRSCTCEGGSQIEGTDFAGRVTYRGVLTGRKFEQGDPPWRWLELAGRSIDDHSGQGQQLIWCEESFVFFEDEE